jgi:hypothetical protein
VVPMVLTAGQPLFDVGGFELLITMSFDCVR